DDPLHRHGGGQAGAFVHGHPHRDFRWAQGRGGAAHRGVKETQAMMMDYENMFSIGQAITTTANSTNVIKIQKAGEFTWGGTTITSRLPIPYKDLGKGEPIQIHVQVVADFASG